MTLELVDFKNWLFGYEYQRVRACLVIVFKNCF